MKVKNRIKFVVAVCAFCVVSSVQAVELATQIGKVTMVEGHFVPGCRMLKHKETATGTVKSFRVRVVAGGQDDISAVAMAALVANRDVIIHYDPALAAACGSEPEVRVIDMF